jgi:hypothetical protein
LLRFRLDGDFERFIARTEESGGGGDFGDVRAAFFG